LANGAEKTIKVIIGTPINREHAYVLDKFLDNQRQIQQAYPGCELVLATSEKDYAPKLKAMLNATQLRGTVLTHDLRKPDYARHWVWDVTSGREAIRRHAVSQTEADYLLFLDADMLFAPDVVAAMVKHIDGYDALFNGYALREHGIGLAGAGCLMMDRRVFERIHFRCFEFRNGEVIFEDNLLEMALFRLHARVRKGVYVATDHYQDAYSFKHLEPQPVGKIRELVNSQLIRYALIRSSIVLHRNIPWRLKVVLDRRGVGRKKHEGN
jgi:hypothetical protein